MYIHTLIYGSMATNRWFSYMSIVMSYGAWIQNKEYNLVLMSHGYKSDN